MLTQELVARLFDYVDGKLINKVDRRKAKAGMEAGTPSRQGYRQTNINGKTYFNHRLIFLLFHGYIPVEVEHIDQDKSNSRIENLRPTTRSENKFNVGLNKSNTTGFKGVQPSPRGKPWVARIKVKGKMLHLGMFETKEEAARAYDEAAKKHAGEFACLNFKGE